MYFEVSILTHSGEKKCTLRADSIERVEPSEIDPNRTDIYLLNGDIVLCKSAYNDFKVQWYTALRFLPEETWKTLESKDGKIKIRCYAN